MRYTDDTIIYVICNFPILIKDIRAFYDIGKLYMKVYNTNSDCQEILTPLF